MNLKDYAKATYAYFLLMAAGISVPAVALRFFSGFDGIRIIRPIIIISGAALFAVSAFSAIYIAVLNRGKLKPQSKRRKSNQRKRSRIVSSPGRRSDGASSKVTTARIKEARKIK